MEFEEGWYLLNLLGFRKLSYDTQVIHAPENLGKLKIMRSRKHQGRGARFNYEGLFTDRYDFEVKGTKKRRNHSILVPTLPVCRRCRRTERLERDHIQALSSRGKDESSNLQYLCHICHRFKTSEDRLIETIQQYSLRNRRRRLWECRLKALRDLNPIGGESYVSYWKDFQTHSPIGGKRCTGTSRQRESRGQTALPELLLY